MNLERLRTFQRVACLNSFTKAAEMYNITPSALSKTVKLLEEELKVKLFNRTNNALSLTAEGQNLFHHATKIFRQADLIQDYLNEDINSMRGKINLLAPAGFCTVYLSPYMHKFINAYPELYLSIHSLGKRSLAEYLASDLLVHSKIEGLKGYKQELLVTMELGLYASPDYLQRYGYPETVDDLNNHRLIGQTFLKKHPFIDLNWHLKVGRAGVAHRAPIIEVDETFGRCRLAAEGVGIISVPTIHPDIKKYNLIKLLPKLRGPNFDYYMIVDEVSYTYKRIEELMIFIRKIFS